jgi:hypothetical protein
MKSRGATRRGARNAEAIDRDWRMAISVSFRRASAVLNDIVGSELGLVHG